MDQERRRLLALAALALPGAVAGGGWPGAAGAATEGRAGFKATSLAGVYRWLGGVPVPSDAVRIEAPYIAENGAIVPVRASTTLAGVDRIWIAIDHNPRPLAAEFMLGPTTAPIIETRIKMAETSPVRAIVRSNGALYFAANPTRVVHGGCA